MRTVFVSSTFRDMQAERDAIRDVVAPTINEKAYSHGDRIDFCDLRWGVNTQDLDSDDGARKVLDVCFREIDRSNPPMIIILGNRYGWIPDRKIIKETDTIHQLQLDDLEKSVTALEVEYGAILKQRKTLVYFRNIVGENIPDIYLAENEEYGVKLAELKSKIEKLTNSSVTNYEIHIEDGQVRQSDINDFSRVVIKDLEEALAPEWEQFDKLSPVERELSHQWNFVENKSRMFAARQSDLEACINLIRDPNQSVIVCKGEVGSGKSTLLSKVAEECRKMDMEVFPLISGLSDDSNDALDMLTNEIHFVETYLKLPNTDISIDLKKNAKEQINELQTRLSDLLRGVEQGNRNVLFLVDALDQLYPDDNRDNLIFIPAVVPKGSKFFVTCTNDFEIPYRTSHVLMPLKDDDKRRVIDGICSHIGKELSQEVVSNILLSQEADNPLYISLVVTRLLMMSAEDFDEINRLNVDANIAIAQRQIDILSTCSSNVEKLCVDVFREVGNRINPKLAESVFNLIAASRFGLRIEDLASLCAEEWSQLDFSRFVNFLEEHFQLRSDGRYDYLHKCVRAGLLSEINENNERITINKRISDYLKGLDETDPVRRKEWMHHIIESDDKETFTEFLGKYVQNSDSAYAENAAKICRESSIKDNGTWLIGALEYAAEKGKCSETLQFAIDILPEAYSSTMKDFSILIPVLQKGDSIIKAYEEKTQIESLSQLKISLYHRLGSYLDAIDEREVAFEYAKKYIEESKKAFDWGNDPWQRLQLYTCYYNALVYMKGSSDPEALKEAISIGQEGLDMMDEASWKEYYSRSEPLPYVDCIGEMYQRLENLDMTLKMYDEGLQKREEFYKQHPSKENLHMTSGGYYNIAMTELRFGDIEHCLKAYEHVQKAIQIDEQSCDVIHLIEEQKRHGTDYYNIQNVSFCGRTYHLGAITVGELALHGKMSEEMRKNQLNWAHRAFDIFLFTYTTTELPQEDKLFSDACMNIVKYVWFSNRTEYDSYKSFHEKWMEILKNRYLEGPSSRKCKDYMTIASIIAFAVVRSTFPEHYTVAWSILNNCRKVSLENAIDGNKDKTLKLWFETCSIPVNKMLTMENEPVDESVAQEYGIIVKQILEENSDVEDEKDVARYERVLGLIIQYFLDNSNIPYNYAKGLDYLELCISMLENAAKKYNSVDIYSMLAHTYSVAGLVVNDIDANNPLWKKYANQGMSIYDKLRATDPTKVDEDTVGQIIKLLNLGHSKDTPDNSKILEAFETNRMNGTKALKPENILAFFAAKVWEVLLIDPATGEKASKCLTTKEGERYYPVFTDRLSVQRFLVEMKFQGKIDGGYCPFIECYEYVKSSRKFSGLVVNLSTDNILLPIDKLDVCAGIINLKSLKAEINATVDPKPVELDEKKVEEIRTKLQYEALKLAKDDSVSAQEAIDSYAKGVKKEQVLAVESSGKKGLFKKTIQGHIFGNVFVCSSFFPENCRKIYYASIAQIGKSNISIEIKLREGDQIIIPMNTSTNHLCEVLKCILE